MATVSDLAGGLGTALGTVQIRALPYLSDQFSPPVALVAIDHIAYHESFRNGLADHRFIVYTILARSSDRAALASLEGYMSNTGSTSIRQALEVQASDGTFLSGLAAAVYVAQAGPPAAITVNGVEYVSCPFEVHVHAA